MGDFFVREAISSDMGRIEKRLAMSSIRVPPVQDDQQASLLSTEATFELLFANPVGGIRTYLKI